MDLRKTSILLNINSFFTISYSVVWVVLAVNKFNLIFRFNVETAVVSFAKEQQFPNRNSSYLQKRTKFTPTCKLICTLLVTVQILANIVYINLSNSKEKSLIQVAIYKKLFQNQWKHNYCKRKKEQTYSINKHSNTKIGLSYIRH